VPGRLREAGPPPEISPDSIVESIPDVKSPFDPLIRLGCLGAAVCLVTLGAAPVAARAAEHADVKAVAARGAPGAYIFRVTVRSPDASCQRYTSWWEVVRSDGSLAYRRILDHSHAGEQPFTREGGPVPVRADEVVVVRAHFVPDGFGGAMLRGSVQGGFKPWNHAPPGFAGGLAHAAPQPETCLY